MVLTKIRVAFNLFLQELGCSFYGGRMGHHATRGGVFATLRKTVTDNCLENTGTPGESITADRH